MTNKISRSDIDGSNVEDLYTFPSDRPFTLALDVAAGDLYFASPDSDTINRAKMDGSAAPVVIYDANDASAAPNNTNSGNPGIRDVRGIALDVAAGMIYWTDRGTGADRVVRGTMDGTMVPQLLYTQGSGSAQMVALDIDAGMLYWTNSGRSQIERGKMDGSGSRESIYTNSSGSGGSVVGLVVDAPNGDLYWTSVTSDDIRRGKLEGANAVDGTPVVVRSGLANPWALAIATSGAFPPVVDEAPNITLTGTDPYDVECGIAYIDLGASAIDDLDGDISVSIVVDSSNVNTSALGSYTVTYDVTDSGGNAAVQVTRTVTVSDTTPPVIALSGSASEVLECGVDVYAELGASATDVCDPSVTVVIGGDSVNVNSPGVYVLTYNASDASGNVGVEVSRTVTVVDTTAPVIGLIGSNPQEVSLGSAYVEAGASVVDCEVGLAAVIDATSVNTGAVGSYLVTYNVTDSSGNVASQVTRTVDVTNSSPSILVDLDPITVDEGQTASNSGSFSDVNAGDELSLAYSVGTGTGSGGQSVGQNGNWNWSFTPTDGVDDSQLITVTATDQSGDQGIGTFQLNVSNVPPSVAVDTSTVTVDEGQTAINAGTMFDPGDDTVSIAASTGVITSTTPIAPAIFGFEWLGGSSTQDTVTTSSTTLTAGIDMTLTTANVGHFWSAVDNSGAIGGYSVGANAEVTLSFSQAISSFRMHMWDMDNPDESLEDFSILPTSVDGDFSISGTQVVSAIENGAGNLVWENLPAGTTSLSFTYVRPASGGLLMDVLEIPGGQGDWAWEVASTNGPLESQVVTITATDSDGASSTVDFNLEVNNVAPDFEAGVDEALQPVIAGLFDRGLIPFTDPGADVWTGTVNYGEGGGSEPLAVDGAGKTLSLNHVYTNEGTFTVSVELEDGDGGTHQDTFQVTVLLNEAPIAACQDLIIAADAVNCSVSVLAANLDGGSTDPDGDLLTLSISPTGPFGVGVHLVNLTVTDPSGLSDSCVATVTVNDTTAPAITLNGNGAVSLECAIDSYTELGASVSDACDPNVTVVIGGDVVDASTNGVYVVTYDATDASGNVATKITRTVTVGDATAPVITLAGAPSVGGGGTPGELTFIATYKNGQGGITGLDGAEKPYVSPDGKNVYAVAKKTDPNQTGFLLVFSRDAVTGELTYLENESGHPGIDGPKHLVVSPDGKWVYVCTLKDQSVLTFSRDATDGRLTYLDTIDVGRNMTYIDTTPDGENLYAVSSRHVERFTIDTVTGLPTWIERVQPPSSSAGDKLTVSDDGKFLYWGDINANRVYVFSIEGTTGGLTHLQTFNNGDSGSLINGVTDLKISPDGLFLYIAATRDDYLTVFSRDVVTGLITYANDIASPSGAVRSLAISPDGATMIAADQSNSIRAYSRDLTTGALTLIEEERDGVNGVDGLARSLGVAISPDGNHIYVAARDDDAVTLFELEPGVIVPVVEAFVTLECSVDSYTEYGADATDACDPNVTVLIGGDVVDATVPGVYVVTYDATDASGNAATQVTRTVMVEDTTSPVIALTGDNPQEIECSTAYVELGASASDDCDQALGAVVIDASGVDVSTPGSYVVTYNISDASGNAAVTVARTVNLIDTTPPVVVLLGDSPQVIESPNAYTELGATASDTCDQALGAVVIDASLVDVLTPGSYVVTYNISDATGNAAVTVTRTVNVIDSNPPVITLIGDAALTLECGIDAYTEDGANVTDTSDPGVVVVIGGDTVDPNTPGVYVVTYDATDASENAAAQLIRTVTVLDTIAPVLTLNGDGVMTLECAIDGYLEQGASVSDVCDLNVTVVIGGDTVDSSTPGTYIVTYDATDASGNVATQITRTVTVGDTTSPVITLLGEPPVGGSAGAGELTFIATYKNGQNGITGLDGPEKVAISGDGKHVYAIQKRPNSNNTGSVVVFSRDAATGELTHVETELGHQGIDGALHVIVSPDDRFVYLCTLKDQSVLTFSRDATDGRLTYLDTIDVGRNMTYIDTTPDGKNLYAVSSRHVERFTIDTVTGLPTWIERVQPPSSSAGDKLTVSDDGKFLYWGDINANRVYVFSIDGTTGGVTHLQTFNNGDSGSLISGVTDLKISPDGLFLYIAATRDDHLTVFSRDVTTGLITYASDIASPSGAVRGLAISPDGATLIAADQSNSIRSYARNFTTGALTLVEEERDGTNGVDGLDRSLGVVISPDGNHVYIAAKDDDAVTAFELEPAVITVAEATMTLECAIDSYTEWGASASDACDPNVTVLIGGDVVDATVPGVYVVTYDASDSSGNAAAQVTRTVTVSDVTPPVIVLVGDNPQVIECPNPYVDLGATASDSCDLVLGAVLIDASGVDVSTPGSYVVTYDISDASGNAAVTVTRTVNVIDTTPPVIVLAGSNPQIVEGSSPYVELGAAATDTCDQALGAIVIDASAVDTAIPGIYVVTYDIMDASGNAATTVVRSVEVTDTTPPVITLVGANPQVIECPNPYVELGATAFDASDLALGAVVIDATAVNVSVPGIYPVTYDISDASGNAAVTVVRSVEVIDTTPPVIALLGDNPQLLECPSPYVELGATALDACDQALGLVLIDASAVDAATPGDYVVTYNISDASGNVAVQLTRTVTVRDTAPPVLALLGDNPQLLECPSPYVELGATASDTCDQALGLVLIDASAVDATTPGDYVVTYNISDASGNVAVQLTRTVTVRDATPPVIALLGDNPQLLECPSPYVELGATATDTCDQALGLVLIDASAVDATTPGDYVVTYNISDASGNAAVQLTRTVTVRDTTPPVIALLGDNPQLIECPSPYVELGATASDTCDQALGAVVIDASAVDASTPGDYVVTYNISDASGNAAVQVTRTVRVQDTTSPVITLTGLAALTLECSVDSYSEEGATVIDTCDTTVTVVVGGDTVDPTHVGTYVVTYDSTDASGNVAVQLTRTVTVVDTTPPVIALLGYNPETIECPDPYQEEGATASDLCDGDLTVGIVIDSSEVNSTVPGTYEVSYTVEDAAGNSTTEIREIEVVDTTVPVISLTGDANVVLLQGDTYIEEGATVTDTCDQSVSVVIGGDAVDSSIIGVYVVTYDSTDSSGNVATQVSRTVTILPRFAALSALFGCADLKAEQDSLVNGSVGSTQSVDLHSQSEVTGDVVNVTGKVDVKSKAVVGGNIDAGGQVTVAKDASVGSSVISGEKIDLKKNAIIGGDATSGGQVKLASGASVAGVITENAGVLPLTDIPLPVLALTTSGSNVSVKKNKSATVLPGGYKKLSGKQSSTISLSSGYYAFSEIDVDRNSVIELDVSAGPITVDVVGKVHFDGIEMMLIGGSVTDVLFQVQGDSVILGTTNAAGNGGSGKSGKSGSSKGAGDSDKIGSYVGTYLAPNAQLTLEDGGLLNGTAYASKIHLKQNSVVNPEPALELLIAASASWLGMESCIGTGGGSSGKSGKSGKSEDSGSSKESGSGSEASGKSGKDSGGGKSKQPKSKGKKN